jgi:proteasome component ECM29
LSYLSSGEKSIMAASAPSEARELELVGKVEMRIALAKDEKLESVLKVYLPPVLLKLGSDHQSVRNKVIIISTLL